MVEIERPMKVAYGLLVALLVVDAAERGRLHALRIPVDAGYQFRSMPGQDSGPCRATVAVDAGRGV